MKIYCMNVTHPSTLHEETVDCVRTTSLARRFKAGETALDAAPKPVDTDTMIAMLQRQVDLLRRELAGAKDRYDKLNEIYNKLADQWNAFQATARPDNRNVHRAEASGELARKLAEVFIALAYDKDADDLIRKLLAHFSRTQDYIEMAERVLGRGPHGG